MNKKLIKHQNVFPCIGCVVSTCCTELCNKLETDFDWISTRIIKRGQCPDCSSIFTGKSNAKSEELHFYNCKGCNHSFLGKGSHILLRRCYYDLIKI